MTEQQSRPDQKAVVRVNLLNAHMISTIEMLAILMIKTFTVSVLLSAVKCSTPGLCPSTQSYFLKFHCTLRQELEGAKGREKVSECLREEKVREGKP